MSKLMELADAYASLQSEVEYLQDQGTTNQMATVYPDVYRKYEEAHTAVLEAVEKLERDAARYRWLMANCALGIKQFGLGWSLNTRQGVAPDSLKDVSAAIDAAMEATNGQGN